MKNQNKLIVKVQLLLLLAVGVATPCLYAQCVTQATCSDPHDPVQVNSYCSGSAPEPGAGEGGDWLGGDSPCGTVHITSTDEDTGVPCGSSIDTECA